MTHQRQTMTTSGGDKYQAVYDSLSSVSSQYIKLLEVNIYLWVNIPLYICLVLFKHITQDTHNMNKLWCVMCDVWWLLSFPIWQMSEQAGVALFVVNVKREERHEERLDELTCYKWSRCEVMTISLVTPSRHHEGISSYFILCIRKRWQNDS